jgi:probable rRNA maturation factor
VYVSDEQDAHPVDVRLLTRLAEAVLEEEGVRGDCELSIFLVDAAAMTELNARFMGADRPTDVLAFPIDDVVTGGRTPDAGTTGPDRFPDDDELGSDVPILLGDVVLCPAVAVANAPGHAGTYEDELRLLLVHGILHVLGMDHAEPDQAAAMQARERHHLARSRPVEP